MGLAGVRVRMPASAIFGRNPNGMSSIYDSIHADQLAGRVSRSASERTSSPARMVVEPLFTWDHRSEHMIEDTGFFAWNGNLSGTAYAKWIEPFHHDRKFGI